MRASMITLALVGVALLPGEAVAQRRGVDAGRYGWLGSLESGKSEARRSGKPLMVVIRCVP
jgi:hypothetical protein